MGTKNNPGAFDCYVNAEPDEPMFVLLARDPFAPHLVRMWAAMRDGNYDAARYYFQSLLREDKRSGPAKISEAYGCSNAMVTWKESQSR